MTQESNRIPNFDDIIFEHRNRDYGAYLIRKKNKRDLITSILIGPIIMATIITAPYVSAKNVEGRQKYAERQIEIKMETLNQPDEIVLPAPPPPPTEVAILQTKYIPPVIVDSINSKETERLMTADEAQINIRNEEVVEIVKEVKEEVQDGKAEPEPFFSVEEMPEPPGGVTGLYNYIAENTVYPERAHENNIQGKVFVRFCVTSKGNIEQVSIYKSVDPELDAEAI